MKNFEHRYEAASGKFYTWPSVMGHSQNTGTLQILYKLIFWLGGECVCVMVNFMFRPGSYIQDILCICRHFQNSRDS